MSAELRSLIVEALYSESAYVLPDVCVRVGLDGGSQNEAFSSKRRYVTKRLAILTNSEVAIVAAKVLESHPSEALKKALGNTKGGKNYLSEISRKHLVRYLDTIRLEGSEDLMELLTKHWPDIRFEKASPEQNTSIFDFIQQHAVYNYDIENEYVLKLVGFHKASQFKIFRFLEDVVHPRRRDEESQHEIVSEINKIIERDGFCLTRTNSISGYPVFDVVGMTPAAQMPADQIISDALFTFDEESVHSMWNKALSRRSMDPDGAITAAKSLVETVCKHILDDAGQAYGDKDDLPKLYNATAEQLKLSPVQYDEPVFKAILGNCQAVVNQLASIRNKLGDSHGTGKRATRPQPRHAELAVNLAGSMAMFLVSTWAYRQSLKGK
ncbi:abortive infection family protein [Pseudokordiimonas caeni]|uniref:abortive infection family protein n=1 Tax=Pseudokordiimonas caeni TaxID=2997908 RepID=UPI00281183D3|nr:abortive infection family protein [Pseudokordiimonas caeni]